MSCEVLEILNVGLGVSFQDAGRRGWKRFGVPPGGAMDQHAADWANTLVGNHPKCPVIELLLHGARFRALREVELALTGAATHRANRRWGTVRLRSGDVLEVEPFESGLWSYLAVHGGFQAPEWFGSVSAFPRGGLGENLAPGVRLAAGRVDRDPAPEPTSMGNRWVSPRAIPSYSELPAFRVWDAPQSQRFSPTARARLFEGAWRISSRSDRTGYRLLGEALETPVTSAAGIPSEPVLVGTLQVPPEGLPIVTMRDGPTVGGYPKIGLLDARDLSLFAQCRPDQIVRFQRTE